MKAKTSLSKRLRFEVFKRDNFTCQYCGSTPPKVILEIDHIIPVFEKGENVIENLVTACFDCNRGKSNISLISVPDTVSERIIKIREQELQLKEFTKIIKRKEKRIENDIKIISEYFLKLWENKYSLNEHGKLGIKKYLEYFNTEEIKEAITIGFRKARENGVDGSFRYAMAVLRNWKNGVRL